MDVPTLGNDFITTKFLLDSGDPQEYRELAAIAEKAGSELWGSTTNPSLIAKKLASEGKKLTTQEAFHLQKQIVMEIIDIVPGAVSAEVYAEHKTTAADMIAQGEEIATWHKRVVVKLPTTVEGFKARTALRKQGIMTNNTLVFSQEQVFAICLHEQLIQKAYGPTNDMYPPFISPFVGRLDDIGQNGMHLVENSMRLKGEFTTHLPASVLSIWMLEASVRTIDHMKRGIAAKSELITAPAKLYKEWFALPAAERQSLSSELNQSLEPIAYWQPSDELRQIDSLEAFDRALTSGKFDIHHELTDKGIDRFVADWQAVLRTA